jgi:flagellar secretion chaperone FliS
MNGKGISAYKQSNVITADPKKLVILCYETIITNLRMAQESYASNDYETKAKCIQKAQDIICELTNALDFEKGGQVAGNLYALYGFFTRHIIEADLKRDIEALEEDIKMLEELKSAWQEIFYGLPKIAGAGHAVISDMSKRAMVASYRA